ncbi:unnamed protein product, partial [marine sediment metagenome]
MASIRGIGIERATYQRLRRAYRRQWKVSLLAVGPDGRVVFTDRPRTEDGDCRRAYRHAIQEVLRWGESTVVLCPPKRLIWAVPLMHNAVLLGGLIAGATERRVFPDRTGSPAMDMRAACAELRVLAEQANLTNAALLAARRREYHRERQRAEVIHQLKLMPYADVREIYLRDEPALIAAIRKDDRAEARGILNRLLAAIHHQAGNRLDLIKSFFMELIATMCRTAVEAGGNPEKLFGTNFAS